MLDCWDFSKKVTIAFRSKTMLQLAQLKPDEVQIYKDQHAGGELRHPVLASVRVHIQKQKDTSTATEHAGKTMSGAFLKLMLQSTLKHRTSLHSQSSRLKLSRATSQRFPMIRLMPSMDWWRLGHKRLQVNVSQQQRFRISSHRPSTTWRLTRSQLTRCWYC